LRHWVANLNWERAFGARLAFTAPVELKSPNQAEWTPSFCLAQTQLLGKLAHLQIVSASLVAVFTSYDSGVASQIQPS
jgi:hypothetical protein